MSNIVSKSKFAEILGKRSPSYVTQLLKEERIVLTDDGKKVLVAESLALIEKTKDVTKEGVAKRHEENRAKSPDAKQKEETNAYWQRKINEEKFKAIQRENEIAEGKLLVADNVINAVFNAMTILRNRFESQPDRLSAQLAAETDPIKCRAMIIDDNEIFLTEISQCFKKLGAV